jgi:hypothetical protein
MMSRLMSVIIAIAFKGESMKSFDKIAEDTQVQILNQVKTIDGDMAGIEGYLNLRDGKKTMTFMASIDDNGKWEHVSVSYNDENKKLPTWTEMCAVKDLFWEPEEEVHQIHPKHSQYVHGYGRKENILHLWRPVGGWSEEE